jgi:hypothetical protein
MRIDGVLHDLAALQDHGHLTWAARERGWVAVPDEVVTAFALGGFEECKRATTTSRRDLGPAGGLWQGVNHATGSVASAIWVTRTQGQALMFIEIDGEAIDAIGDNNGSDPFDQRSYEDEGGES